MTQSYGETLYFENQRGPRVIAATYDEHRARQQPDHPAYGFFRPYGDRAFEVSGDDVLDETLIDTPLGRYTRVDLAMDFLSRNGLDVLPPLPKWPLQCSGWAPYRTMDNFCERISLCDPEQPIRRAVTVVTQARTGRSQVARAFAELASVTGASLPRTQEQAHERARIHLSCALQRDTRDDILAPAIDAALPGHLPVPERCADEHEMASDRGVWQLRLLYALVLGVHRGRLPARA